MKLEVFEGIPTLICDQCAGRILDKELVIKYHPEEGMTLVTHKGRCDLVSAGGEAPGKWHWMTPAEFVCRLADRYALPVKIKRK